MPFIDDARCLLRSPCLTRGAFPSLHSVCSIDRPSDRDRPHRRRLDLGCYCASGRGRCNWRLLQRTLPRGRRRKEGRKTRARSRQRIADGQTDTLADLQGVVVVSCERVSLGPFNALARPCSVPHSITLDSAYMFFGCKVLFLRSMFTWSQNKIYTIDYLEV